MSLKRDSLLIILYAIIIITIVGTTNHIATMLIGPFSFVPNLYLWLFNLLISIKSTICPIGMLGCALAIFLVFLAAYALVFSLYLISWGITEIGRLFIQAWGEAGGPGVGIGKTIGYCIPSTLFYLLAWWLCPVNHRPITNLTYNLQLMRLWPLTILLIVLIGSIPGAALSNHYRDVCEKILDNYPYR